jgi:hypothetical protein
MKRFLSAHVRTAGHVLQLAGVSLATVAMVLLVLHLFVAPAQGQGPPLACPINVDGSSACDVNCFSQPSPCNRSCNNRSQPGCSYCGCAPFKNRPDLCGCV